MYKLAVIGCIGLGFALAGCGSTAEGDTEEILSSPSALTGCVPPAGFVAIFQGNGGTGSCQYLTAGGVYPIWTTFGLPDNSIQSVRLGSGTRVTVFPNTFYGGTGTILYADTDNLASKSISAIRAEWASEGCELAKNNQWAPGRGEVAVFRDANFAGDCMTESASRACPLLANSYPAGQYPTALYCIGQPNDSISSAIIGPHTTVTFYRDDYFGGTADTMINTTDVSQRQPVFANNKIGNDNVSSMVVDVNGP